MERYGAFPTTNGMAIIAVGQLRRPEVADVQRFLDANGLSRGLMGMHDDRVLPPILRWKTRRRFFKWLAWHRLDHQSYTWVGPLYLEGV